MLSLPHATTNSVPTGRSKTTSRSIVTWPPPRRFSHTKRRIPRGPIFLNQHSSPFAIRYGLSLAWPTYTVTVSALEAPPNFSLQEFHPRLLPQQVDGRRLRFSSIGDAWRRSYP